MLTATTFNWLGQYHSSPDNKAYSYIEFDTLPSCVQRYSLCLPTEGEPGWDQGWVPELSTKMVAHPHLSTNSALHGVSSLSEHCAMLFPLSQTASQVGFSYKSI